MRVLRLDLSTGRLELHPFVSVIRGLSPAAREEALAAFGGVAGGAAPSPGLVEAHGVLLDLTPASLSLLDLREAVDVVVRADDLPARPGGDAEGAGVARRTFAQAEAAHAAALEAEEAATRVVATAKEALETAQLEGATPGPELRRPELDRQRSELERMVMARAEVEGGIAAAEQALADARLWLAEAETASGRARESRAQAARAVSVAAAAIETTSGRRDPMAAAGLAGARQRLAEAEAAVDAAREQREPVVDPVPDDLPPVEELTAERLELETAILALDAPDPFPVQLALEQLREADGDELVAVPAALTLADDWATLAIDVAGAGADDDPTDDLDGGDRRAEARRRLEAAQAGIAAAEAAVRLPQLDPELVVELEEAHHELLEAKDSADKRFGGAKAAKRVDEARTREEGALDKMSFRTYTEFVMGAHGVEVDPAAERQLDAAREELAAAEAAMRELEAGVAVELERAELLERRRKLRAKAVVLLGADPGDDVEAALRRHRVPARETSERSLRLRAALEGAGLVLGDEDFPERTLVDLAKVWLTEHGQAASQRTALENRVAGVDQRLAVVEREQRPSTDGDGESALALAVARLEEAKSGLGAAENRAGHDAAVDAEIEERREAFQAAMQAEHLAAVALTEAEAALADALAGERAAASARSAANARLAELRDDERVTADLVAEFEARVANARAEGAAQLEADVAEAESAQRDAEVRRLETVAALDEARQAAAEAAGPEPEADDAAQQALDAETDDVEWYLLARLATQRSVSFAGSVPLVLDDALTGFAADRMRLLLARLERMASTVQVIVLTEDLTAAAWAEGVGPDRAAVVEPAAVTAGL